MARYLIPISITLRGPILSRSTASGDHGVDSVFFRDSQDRLGIPGTLVKGRLLDAWRTLGPYCNGNLPDENTIHSWFGKIANNAENGDEVPGTWDPHRGQAKFPEAFVCTTNGNPALHTRIQIEDDRGAADDGLLFVEERPFAVGESVRFQAEIAFWGKKDDAEQFANAVQFGLRSILSLGGNQGVGYGRVLTATIDEIKTTPKCLQDGLPDGTTIKLNLRTEEPLCITEHRPAGNIFKSIEHIPGGVLKGAIARQLEDLGKDNFKELLAWLDKIRIRHARPRIITQPLPYTRPLSIVVANNKIRDVVHCKNACLIEGEAPKFAVDWKDKDYKSVTQCFTTVTLNRQLTVRTQIDPVNRRAKDEQLFAYESVLPKAGGCDVDWVTAIDFPDGVPASVKEQLKQVLQYGLGRIGKTKAYFTLSAHPQTEPPALSINETVAITLVTPALIGNPMRIEDKDKDGKQKLLDYYKHAWCTLCPGLELSHFFAQQQLAGGKYLWKRFQKTEQYRPWLLTKAGSVFVFTVKPENKEAVSEFLQSCLQKGLPHFPPDSTWENNPFVRENGYGEIAVNLHENWKELCHQPSN
jgi:hypothetical protein